MKVRSFPKTPGPPAWDAILPQGQTYPELRETQTVDWLVIGAGFAGLSAARRLQERAPTDRITILDAKRIAEGPSGRNTGFMIDLPHDLASEDYGGNVEKDRATIAQNRAAIDFAKQTVESFDMPPEAFRDVGKINGAASAKGMTHNSDYAKHLENLGEAHEMLDAKMMHEITGTRYYQGGLFTPGTVMLQPALYIRALAQNLLSNRLQIYENSPVQSLEHEQGLWVASTGQGRVAAPKVILATNGHIQNFGFYKRRFVHVFTYGSMTRALTPDEDKKLGGHDNWGLTPADPLGSTVRRITGRGGSRIIVRNRFTYEPSMQPSENKLAAIYQTHQRSFDARFPMLGSVSMEHQWGGHLTLSLNNVAAFGEVGEGLYSACCQNGLGTVKGTLHGICAADLATGHITPMVQSLLSEAQPAKLPPEPFATLGARAKIRWGEYRAGPEL